MYNKKSSVFLKVFCRRKDGVIESQITGTEIWAKVDEMISEAINAQDFSKHNDVLCSWQDIKNDGYEYCIVNLRD